MCGGNGGELVLDELVAVAEGANGPRGKSGTAVGIIAEDDGNIAGETAGVKGRVGVVGHEIAVNDRRPHVNRCAGRAEVRSVAVRIRDFFWRLASQAS